MNKSVLALNSVKVIFGEHTVFSNVSFNAKEGEFVSVLGKSGAGKSTMLNAIAGFVPYSGDIRRPKNISFVFQNYSLFPWMSVRNNISFGVKERKESKQIINHMLSMIGLTDKQHLYPFQLSGGQQQRVAFARALAIQPDLLLLDEPFGSLDFSTKLNMQDWLGTILTKTKMTVLLVTHDVDEAIFFSDKVIVLTEKMKPKEVIIDLPHPRLQEVKYTKSFQLIKRKILNYITC